MDRFLQYTLEDFITDDSFIAYCQGRSIKDAQQWISWLEQHPEKAAIAQEAKQVILLMSEENPIPTEIKESMWKKIDAKTPSAAKTNTQHVRQKRLSLTYIIPLAAACLGLIVLVWKGLPSEQTTTSSASDYMAYTQFLPDSSRVELVEGSTMVLDSMAWPLARHIELDGKAYFHVKKGSPFTVTTDRGSIEVLGTSFSVDAQSNEFNVHCYTGHVAVTYQNQRIELKATDRLEASQKGTKVVQDTTRPTWIKENYAYDAASLDYVFRDLSHIYDLHIECKGCEGLYYSGLLVTNDLQKALEMICWPSKLHYTIKGKNVVISNE